MAKLQPDYIKWVLTLNATEAQEELHKLEKANGELKKQTDASRKAMAQLEAEGKKGSVEWENLRKSISQNNREMAQNRAKMDELRQRLDLGTMSVSQLRKRMGELRREFNNTSRALNPEHYDRLRREITRVQEALDRANGSARGLRGGFMSLEKMKQTLIGFFNGIGLAITGFVIGSFSKMIGVIQDFEQMNSKLAAVLGTTIDGVSALTEQARLLGRTTTATASEVTALQTELAKLGFVQKDIENLTPSTLKFANAVGTDLPSAAAFAGAAMRMFNKDASEAESVMATFAVATTSSALDFNKLQASLATIGPVANAFGFSVEETTALLGQLSNAGFDASSAATATRNILLALADEGGSLAQALGAPVRNLDDLVAGLKKLNAEGIDLAAALELTDKSSVAAFSTFLKGTDDILALRDAITDCTGDFDRMADTMADNAAGSWAGLQSAMEGLLLKFFDLREALKAFYGWATKLVNWIGSVLDALSPLGKALLFLGGAVGGVVSALGQLVGWMSSLFTQTRAGRAVLNGVVAAMVAYKTATLLASAATRTFYTNIIASIKGLVAKAAALVAQAAASVKAAIATRSFNAALMANPVMLVVGAVALLVSGITALISKTDEATESTDAWTEANREASRQYGEQKGRIEALVMVAENENLSLKRRQKAVMELNRIIPGYNARIDETTGKYIASKQALDAYLSSLEKEMRYKANTDRLQKLVSAAEEARDAYDEAVINAEAAPKYLYKWYGKVVNSEPKKAMRDAKATWEKAEEEARAFKGRMEKAMNDGVIAPPDAPSPEESPVVRELKGAAAAADDAVQRLREINAELKELRKRDPQSDDELHRIQERIKALQEEKRLLMGKSGKGGGRREAGTYAEESIAKVTAPIDDGHQKRMLEINRQDISATERSIEKNKELIRYYEELNVALEEMRRNTSSSHTKTLDAITAEQNRIAEKAAAAYQEIDKAMVRQDAETHEKRMAATELFYTRQSDLIRAAVISDGSLEKASSVYLMQLERQSHDDRLKELQRYYDEVAAADYYSTEEKGKLFGKQAAEIQKVQSQILTDTGKFSEALREAMADTTSADGIAGGFARQIEALEVYYQTLEDAAGVSADDVVALEREKQRRIDAIRFQALQKEWELQDLVGASWADEYSRELAKLENYHRQGLMKEKDYQKKRLELGVSNARKYYDYYSGLSASMFSAIQEAEIARSEAKYDVLIQQAKNNGEETAAIEQEKENRKLEIQKKYADVDFAIKVSQIVADTAVAIMKAFAQLGPIGGAVAAALMTATGVAQVAAAKAERDKVRDMQPGKVSGAASAGSDAAAPAKAERVLSGYAEGGYTGDGGRYEVAGVVHRGEYVVPQPIMDNPRVVDAVGIIESIRRGRFLGSGQAAAAFSSGYADGGYVGAAPATDMSDLAAAVRDLKEAAGNIRAYVVLRDIDRARDTAGRAAAPFTRKR